MQTLIDCYGHLKGSVEYMNDAFAKKAYLVDTSGSVTYICFDEKPERAIHKITVDGGTTTIAWAFGAWDDRATLAFTTPLSTPITVGIVAG